MVKLNIKKIIKTNICCSTTDADIVFKKLKYYLSKNIVVELSFENVDTIIPCFLATAIGQLYGCFKDEHINTYLTITNIDNDVIDRTINNSKKYYKNMKGYDSAWESVLEK